MPTAEATGSNRTNRTASERFVPPTRHPERPLNGKIDRSPAKTTGVHSSHGIAFEKTENRSRETPGCARPDRLRPTDRDPSGRGSRPLNSNQ